MSSFLALSAAVLLALPAVAENATAVSPGARPAKAEPAAPVVSQPIGASSGAAAVGVKEVPTPPPMERAAVADAVALPMLELFNVEQAPGQGTLKLEMADRKEEYTLGAASGYYALGIVFSGKHLPPPASQDLESHELLQISFGSMRNRLQGQVPQFASIAMSLDQLTNGKITVPIEEPNARQKGGQSAYVLVTAATTPNERSDEEKLKGFFFGQSGKLVLTAQGGERVVEGKAGGRRYSFRVRFYELGLDAALGTPFNALTGRLAGKVVVPVYRPNGRPAQALLERIAAESFESSLTRSYATDRERMESTSPKKSRKKK